MSDERKPYITVTKGMRGYFAAHIWWNPAGFEEVWQAGIGSYATPAEAAQEAREWAEAEDVEFRPGEASEVDALMEGL